MKKNLAWHFCGDKLRDDSPRAKPGQSEIYRGKLFLCQSGLHFSRTPFEALQYAQGSILRPVWPRGQVLEPPGDKGCCSERAIVAEMDATELLRYFARMQAVSVLHLWETEPPEVVCDYLMTGDETLKAAAMGAAWAAAGAARAAAAARGAAWVAAKYATREATGATGGKWVEFNALVYESFEDFL